MLLGWKATWDKWDKYLPALGMAVWATVNSSTGYSPNMLQLGREVVMPIDVWLEGNTREEAKLPAAFVKKLREVLQEVHADVRKNLGVAQATTKWDYDVKARVTSFEVEDLECRQNTAHWARLSRKLYPTYLGPYLVLEVLSPYLYPVEDRKRVMVLYHDKLKLCQDREIPMWIHRRRHRLLGERDSCAMAESVPDTDVPEDGVLD